MNFYELRSNNVRRVLMRPGWTIEDIRQAIRDAESGVAYCMPGCGRGRREGSPAYRVRSEGKAFAVERVSDRHIVLGPVDLDTAREFVREANAAASRQARCERQVA